MIAVAEGFNGFPIPDAGPSSATIMAPSISKPAPTHLMDVNVNVNQPAFNYADHILMSEPGERKGKLSISLAWIRLKLLQDVGDKLLPAAMNEASDNLDHRATEAEAAATRARAVSDSFLSWKEDVDSQTMVTSASSIMTAAEEEASFLATAFN
jgi:hypothetical protein